MKELFQPMRAVSTFFFPFLLLLSIQLPLKEEPEEENEGEVQVIQENRQPNPVPTHQPQHRPMYIPPSHFKEGPHHATSHPIFYQNGNGVQNIRRRLSPSPSEATRISADSPPLEKKSKPITGWAFIISCLYLLQDLDLTTTMSSKLSVTWLRRNSDRLLRKIRIWRQNIRSQYKKS